MEIKNLFLFLLCVICSCDSDKNKNPVLTMAEKEISEVHHVPFMRVLVTPDEYDRKNIQLIGFLAIDDGMLKLFPSKDAFASSDRVSAIELRMPYDKATDVGKRLNRKYVVVVGDFSSTVQETLLPRDYRMGSLENIDVLLPIDEKWYELSEGTKELTREE